MTIMAAALSPFFRDTSFDPFLFSEIGEERNGMLLSMVSALARLDLDPWREAASLSRLTATAVSACGIRHRRCNWRRRQDRSGPL